MTKIILAAQRDEQRLAEVQARHPGVELVVAETRDQVLDQIGDADGLFGARQRDGVRGCRADSLDSGWQRGRRVAVERARAPGPRRRRGHQHAERPRRHHRRPPVSRCCSTSRAASRSLARLQEREEWGRGQLLGNWTALAGQYDRHRRLRQHRAGDRAAGVGFEMNVLAVDAHPGEPGRRRRRGLAAHPAWTRCAGRSTCWRSPRRSRHRRGG